MPAGPSLSDFVVTLSLSSLSLFVKSRAKFIGVLFVFFLCAFVMSGLRAGSRNQPVGILVFVSSQNFNIVATYDTASDKTVDERYNNQMIPNNFFSRQANKNFG